MIPVLLFLVIAGLLFFALVETAFSLLMRLPQRLEAERESTNGALASYLEDPLQFFIPSRVMRGILLVAAVVLLAQPIDRGFPGWLVLFGSGVLISVGVGQILPTIIVRRSPERVLEILLPVFTAVANLIVPLTVLITAWMGSAERRLRERRRRTGRTGSGVAAARTTSRRAPTRAGCSDRSWTSARRSCAR